MTYKQSNIATPSQTLGLHRGSRTISKIQPKIRIIHMYAPEIINTDVANFRELVQRLTGKPSSVDKRHEATAKGMDKDKGEYTTISDHKRDNAGLIYSKSTVNTKLEVLMMGSSTSTSTSPPSSPPSSYDHLRCNDDDDQGLWRTTTIDLKNTTSSGGYLNAFSCFDDNFDLNMLTMNSGERHGSSNNQFHNCFGETT